MYAIVEIAGQQFKVSKDQKVYVHRLPNAEDEKVTFSNVLLIDNNGVVTVGAPAINGASVEAKVLKHLKGDKVLIFKKKRRKGYKVKNGHRQYLTQIVTGGVFVVAEFDAVSVYVVFEKGQAGNGVAADFVAGVVVGIQVFVLRVGLQLDA